MTTPPRARAASTSLLAAATVPSHIGDRYQVLTPLGRGGTAVVYRVHDRALDRELALKQLTLQASERNRVARVQFEREFYLLAQLSHPSVIQVYDYGVEAQQPYYTMELLDGGDLSSNAPLSASVACELMVQLCSSLSLLHSRRLVHRDITPRNVRCTLDGRAKLIDFGALFPMGPCLESVGTPGFVAPEVVHRLGIDARTDLYSLGATLYFALTGRKPYAARALADLNELWREPLTPPSRLAARIPPALDALVLALMEPDPARRPQTAFDVMQRLAAIGGMAHAEPEQIARSYLFAPSLVGRETEQKQFRLELRRMLAGRASCVFFEGEAGSGRTRLVDVCAIEAKLAGATVVRVNGRAASSTPLAAAHHIAEQLWTLLPAIALNSAHEADVASALLETASSGARVRSLEALRRDRLQTQAALSAWLRAICTRTPLLLAIDDIDRIDEPSLGWLASAVRDAGDRRLLIIAGLEKLEAAAGTPALEALRRQAVSLPLATLSEQQTEALFASIFPDTAHVALVSHRVHALAAGNLRESMALVQHMLERRLIRYVDGKWSLPAQLTVADLPASVEDAVRTRVAALPELAHRLAEHQALAFEGPFARVDYAALAPGASPGQLDAALATLVAQRIVVKDGATYTLSDLRVRACLDAELSEDARTERHRLLAELCVHSRRHTAFEVHHRLLAGEIALGLDRLRALLAATAEIAAIYDDAGVGRRRLAAILERAYAHSISSARPQREAHELRQRLLQLNHTTDDTAYARHAPTWRARLELDSGWRDYQQLPDSLPASERLQRAMAAARARYEATPEHERVYPVDEAIKLMAHFVSLSLTLATRTRDLRLLSTLPSLLEPFADYSLALKATLHMTLATHDVCGAARFAQAREHMLAAHEQLEKASAAELPYMASQRHAVMGALAGIDANLGYASVLDWISAAEQHPIHRLGALYLRRLLCVFDGDSIGAERYRSEGELLAIQTDGRGSLPVRPALQLMAYLHAADLGGVRFAADLLEQLSRKAPGWIAMHHVAQGYFEHLRGNLLPARAAFERALAVANPELVDPPPDLEAWVLATTGYVTVLTELGSAAEAEVFGVRALRTSEALGLSGTAALIRATALALARHGDAATASEWLDRLIAQRAQLRACMRAPDYEARARIAIWQRDAAASARFVGLAIEHHATLAVRSRLLDEAKQAGLKLAVNVSAVEAALANAELTRNAAANHSALSRFAGLSDSDARAQRALELFVEAAGVNGGHLYYHTRKGLVWRAALACPRDPELDRFAAAYFERQLERAAMTTVFTEPDDAPAGMGMFMDTDGGNYGLAMFGLHADACAGLVALRAASTHARDAAFMSLSKAITRHLIGLGDLERE